MSEQVGYYHETKVDSATGLSFGTNFDFSADIHFTESKYGLLLRQTGDNFSLSFSDGLNAAVALCFSREPSAKLENVVKNPDPFAQLQPSIPDVSLLPSFDATQPISFYIVEKQLLIYAGDSPIVGIPLTEPAKLITQELPTQRVAKKLADPLSATIRSNQYPGINSINAGGLATFGDVNVPGDFVGGKPVVLDQQSGTGSKFEGFNKVNNRQAAIVNVESNLRNVTQTVGGERRDAQPIQLFLDQETGRVKGQNALVIQRPLNQMTDQYLNASNPTALERHALDQLRNLAGIQKDSQGIFAMIENQKGNAYCVYVDTANTAYVLEFANGQFSRLISQTPIPPEATTALLDSQLQITLYPHKRLALSNGATTLSLMPQGAVLKLNDEQVDLE